LIPKGIFVKGLAIKGLVMAGPMSIFKMNTSFGFVF
jgi:hypothetical protein